MRKYFDTVFAPSSDPAKEGLYPVYQAQVTVNIAGTGAAAQLYSADSTDEDAKLEQPVLTDGLGYFEFYVPDGLYDITITYPNAANPKFLANVEIYEDARAVVSPVHEPRITIGGASDRANRIWAFNANGETDLSVDYVELLTKAQEAIDAAQNVVAAKIDGRPVKTVTGDYVLQDTDLGFHIRVNATTTAKVTFDPRNFRDGWYARIEQRGPASFYIKPANGVFLRSANGYDQVALQYGVITLTKTMANEGVADGDLTSIYTPPLPQPINAPILDGFAGASATITGRSTELGSKTWTAVAYTGTNLNPIITDGAGFISGSQGTSPNQTFVYLTAGASNRKWTRRTGKVAMFDNTGTIGTGMINVEHLSITSGGGTTSLSFVALQHTAASGVAGSSYLRCVNAGTVGALTNFGTNIVKIDGDTTDLNWDVSGSARIATHYLNGRQYGAPINVSQMAQAPTSFTNNFGFRGNLGASRVDTFVVADPDTVAMIRQYSPNRVMQQEFDGSVNIKPRGVFTVQDPGTIKIRIEDTAGSVLLDWTTVSNYNCDEQLNYSALAPNLSSPPSSGFIYKVRREDVTGAVVVESNPSPVTKAGEVIGWGGQSLTANPLFATSGGASAAPADGYYIQGTLGQGGTVQWPNDYDRRQLPVVANSPLATFHAEVASLTSAVPMLHVIGTRGGTDASQRLPGTDNHAAQIDGVKHAGWDVGSFIYGGGQFDVFNETLLNSYVSNVRTELNDVRALVGRQFKAIMIPLTSVWGVPDVDSERLRKAMWQACVDYPEEFFPGPYMMDMQHLPGDIYHWVNGNGGVGGPLGGYDEQLRRLASVWCLMRGQSVLDYRGPKLDSVTKNSSSQCTVLIDLNGADSVDILNYAYAGDRRGGLRFSNTPDFAVTFQPNGHTIGAIVGGKQAITYTFDNTPFALSSVYVSGPYGTEPFNPSWDATIRADYANKASMLVGKYTGKPSIPIQPYYQSGDAGDFIVGS